MYTDSRREMGTRKQTHSVVSLRSRYKVPLDVSADHQVFVVSG
jgi:hypothetical protein